jgi:hypothetical protein
VESTSFVSKSLFSSAQSSKVFASFWSDISSEIDDDSANRASIDGDVEEALELYVMLNWGVKVIPPDDFMTYSLRSHT